MYLRPICCKFCSNVLIDCWHFCSLKKAINRRWASAYRDRESDRNPACAATAGWDWLKPARSLFLRKGRGTCRPVWPHAPSRPGRRRRTRKAEDVSSSCSGPVAWRSPAGNARVIRTRWWQVHKLRVILPPWSPCDSISVPNPQSWILWETTFFAERKNFIFMN